MAEKSYMFYHTSSLGRYTLFSVTRLEVTEKSKVERCNGQEEERMEGAVNWAGCNFVEEV